jgi:hypothetical protein
MYMVSVANEKEIIQSVNVKHSNTIHTVAMAVCKKVTVNKHVTSE